MKPIKSSTLGKAVLFISLLICCFSVFAQQKVKVKEDKMKMKSDDMQMNAASPIDTLVIERVMGMKGKSNNGEYKITVPQNDLSIEVDGFKIIPAMGLSTWIDFAPFTGGAMIMGDIILTETDLKPVQEE